MYILSFWKTIGRIPRNFYVRDVLALGKLDIILRLPGIWHTLVRCLPRPRSTGILEFSGRCLPELSSTSSLVSGSHFFGVCLALRSTKNDCLGDASGMFFRRAPLCPAVTCSVAVFLEEDRQFGFSWETASGDNFNVPLASGSHLVLRLLYWLRAVSFNYAPPF